MFYFFNYSVRASHFFILLFFDGLIIILFSKNFKLNFERKTYENRATPKGDYSPFSCALRRAFSSRRAWSAAILRAFFSAAAFAFSSLALTCAA